MEDAWHADTYALDATILGAALPACECSSGATADLVYAQDFCVNTAHGTWSTTF